MENGQWLFYISYSIRSTYCVTLSYNFSYTSFTLNILEHVTCAQPKSRNIKTLAQHKWLIFVTFGYDSRSFLTYQRLLSSVNLDNRFNYDKMQYFIILLSQKEIHKVTDRTLCVPFIHELSTYLHKTVQECRKGRLLYHRHV